MTEKEQNWINRFGVTALDPGYLYVVENNGLFKIGRTNKPTLRLANAKTWLPDMVIIGVKPFWNIRHIENCMHVGFARAWYKQEWFKPPDESYCELLTEGFSEFHDIDRDKNSVDFIY
jgi:hypothetical protein